MTSERKNQPCCDRHADNMACDCAKERSLTDNPIELKAEVARLQRMIEGMAQRISDAHDVIARNAERQKATVPRDIFEKALDKITEQTRTIADRNIRLAHAEAEVARLRLLLEKYGIASAVRQAGLELSLMEGD